MALLDRWFKKKKNDQLKAVESQEAGVRGAAKKAAEKEAEVKEVKKGLKKETEPAASKKKAGRGRVFRVIVRPIVSEKAAMFEQQGVVSFVVSRISNKIEIKRAVRDLYGILPTKVRIINAEGKRVRFGRQTGRRGDWKKAIVTLPKGQTINIHEGV